ncbi:hypothetical protein [Hymenobacter sp. UYCo722]|uniref:DUF7668 domain-containing protein n=1 Tax=Hymenobacter sp. UYCo722 TaxID=3156335 RepID=UPI0033975C69
MKKNRIKATVSFIIDCLAARKYGLLHELDYSQELPSDYIEKAVAEHGGVVTSAPNNRAYRIGVVRHSDIADKIFVDVLLWFDGQESDLTIQSTFHTDMIQHGLYRFSITDLDTL